METGPIGLIALLEAKLALIHAGMLGLVVVVIAGIALYLAAIIVPMLKIGRVGWLYLLPVVIIAGILIALGYGGAYLLVPGWAIALYILREHLPGAKPR
jgi:hypothetical protein